MYHHHYPSFWPYFSEIHLTLTKIRPFLENKANRSLIIKNELSDASAWFLYLSARLSVFLKPYVASESCLPSVPKRGLHPGKLVSWLCHLCSGLCLNWDLREAARPRLLSHCSKPLLFPLILRTHRMRLRLKKTSRPLRASKGRSTENSSRSAYLVQQREDWTQPITAKNFEIHGIW